MSSRIEKLAAAYKESKPEIQSSGIIKRVQLESALAEDRTGQDIKRFSTGLDLLQSTGEFATELGQKKRLATRAGKEFGILDFLVGDEEALAASDLGAALEEEGTVMMDGVKVKAPSIYKEDALDVNRQIKEFRDETTQATEEALGITGELASSLKQTGVTDKELGMDYTDEEIQSMGLKTKTPFQNLLQMFRGG
tara:strand:- start:631 stop:1215 length:585 start_codon:yes stop_codon:yes gene_type:complete